jgi:Predicted AAA-ATPase.
MKYPLGVQSFESIRNDGYFYVDKTALVYQIATSGKYYFLSRPRRFGKSLLVSTFEAYFKGKKELFKGLAIDRLEEEWKEYPTLKLSMNVANYTSVKALEEVLNATLDIWCGQ